MREYKQLTEEDRIEIYAMKQAGKQQNQIAAALGVHSSTISRKLTRNIQVGVPADNIVAMYEAAYEYGWYD